MGITEKLSKSIPPIFAGIVLSILSFALPVMQILITFGQLQNAEAAKKINIIVLAAMLLCSLFTDIHFYRSSPYKSAYPITYFSFCLIFSAVSFFYISNCDFSLIYGSCGEEADSVFRCTFFQICAANAFSLLFRIIFEFYHYLKITKQ